MEKREAKTRQCSMTERNLLHWSGDHEDKETLKQARRKFERHVDAAMPCKKEIHSSTELKASHKVPKTTYGCIVESNESTRQRVELCPPKNNEDQIAGRLFSMTNLHWKITPTLQQQRKELETRKIWLNDEGVQGPLNQRPDFVEANMWKRFLKEIHRFVLFGGQDKEETNNSKDLKNIIIKSILEQDGGLTHGGLTLRSHKETCGIQHLHQHKGNSTTIGSRTKVGILGDLQPGLKSSFFLFRDFFACRKFEFLGNRPGV